jgi:DNA-binding MarR family transcriptional regulator
MAQNCPFQLDEFIPYLLNRAAEVTSFDFQKTYKDTYGMLLTEWRVLFHLGRYGHLTAKQICTMSNLHKTKVSRAVSTLERQRFLQRAEVPTDRRHEILSLTKQGKSALEHLPPEARKHNTPLMQRFTDEEQIILRRCLTELAKHK